MIEGIFDIGPGGVPTNHAALFVTERFIADEEPTILAIMPAHSLLELKWDSCREPFLTFISYPLHVLGMEEPLAKAGGGDVFEIEAASGMASVMRRSSASDSRISSRAFLRAS